MGSQRVSSSTKAGGLGQALAVHPLRRARSSCRIEQDSDDRGAEVIPSAAYVKHMEQTVITPNSAMNFGLEHFDGKFHGESDRACVALGVAELHAQLGLLFQRRLRGDQRQMLASDGALGGFSMRVQLAHALGWLTDDARDDLHAVLSMQDNVEQGFGRSPFLDRIAADRCGALKVAAALLGDASEEGLGALDDLRPAMQPVDEATARAARRRFEVTAELLAKHIGVLSAL